jgi:hypothetical protein
MGSGPACEKDFGPVAHAHRAPCLLQRSPRASFPPVKTREFFGTLPQSGDAAATILVTHVSARLTISVTSTAT